MTTDTLKRALLLLCLSMSQVLLLNRIQLFDCATPMLYVYFVLLFPRRYSKWASLLWCFVLGLIVDTFSNTPGVGCASLTLTAAIQPYLLELFIPRDADETMVISAKTLNSDKFMTYATFLVFIFCLTFFTLEAFNIFNWLEWVCRIIGSTILTVILIMTMEKVRK